MGQRSSHSLDFKVIATVNNTEIRSLINGKSYVHLLDGALIPKFESLYKHSPGKALQFLKKKSRDYWRVDECSKSGHNGKRMQG